MNQLDEGKIGVLPCLKYKVDCPYCDRGKKMCYGKLDKTCFKLTPYVKCPQITFARGLYASGRKKS